MQTLAATKNGQDGWDSKVWQMCYFTWWTP